MKCKNCNCQVSSDFQHSFTTNCCPKCGQTMMQEDVKDLYLQMTTILNKDGNDLGDLAIWLVNTHRSKIVQKEEVGLDTETDSEIEPRAQDTEVEELVKVVKKPTPKVKRTDKEQSLLSADRANLFSKRAGVDKIKYETLVKDIQGGLVSQASEDTNDIGDGEDFAPFNEVPLSNREMQSMAGLFETPDNGQMNYAEIEKLQKLEQLSMTGSLGLIKRSS